MFEHEEAQIRNPFPLDAFEPDLIRHKKKKIMVVDDDQDFRLALCELLVDEGYLVTTAKDGEAALNHLVHQSDLPDLILMDLMMPLKNGLQFRREQEALESIRQIPVLFITGHGIIEGEVTLDKPINFGKVIQTIRSALRENGDQ